MSTCDLTLISHLLCPFVQRSAIVLLEKNVLFERVNVDLSANLTGFLLCHPLARCRYLKCVRKMVKVLLFSRAW
ncbi:Uncharacterised protein [Klebsiella grimontii]|uniref:Uncharacterized protein n=1 Tax=Raoultella terrigena TaxID=577 RepID=A0A485BY89_RAOTE|nr:hypothetical protein [Serratia sp. PL17]VFS77026.1 Uncharacterised protein [Raoultella terrigena]VTS51230.1 Uncharacterised protein [Klebsiella grimontii]